MGHSTPVVPASGGGADVFPTDTLTAATSTIG
jgi:hypothetical protein